MKTCTDSRVLARAGYRGVGFLCTWGEGLAVVCCGAVAWAASGVWLRDASGKRHS